MIYCLSTVLKKKNIFTCPIVDFLVLINTVTVIYYEEVLIISSCGMHPFPTLL